MSNTEKLLSDLIWQGAIHVYQNELILQELKKLNKKEKVIMADIQAVLDKVAALEGDVANITNFVAATKATVDALTVQVADLQAQIAAGTAVTPEQLDDIQARLTAVDAAFDAIAPDPAV